MSGRSATAPCGHPGEVIMGNYVACSVGCGARSTEPKPTPKSNHLESVTEFLKERFPLHTSTCNDPTPYRSPGDHTMWCTGCGCRL